MKKYISALLGACMMMAFATSCSKDTEGLTGITYYPVFELQGNDNIVITAGVPYSDAGATAVMEGKDVTDQIKISTRLDFTDPKPGYYTIDYLIINADGIPGSISRSVVVSAPGDKASGFYTVMPDSFRNTGSITYFGGFPLVVYGDGSGVYHVSDLLGGWYQYRAGYGVKDALTGQISIDADGNISLISSFLEGWGDSADEMANGSFDAETGTLKWEVTYAGMLFSVVAARD